MRYGEENMKNRYKLCGNISLMCYIFILYQLWHLCRYGGFKRHLPMLLAGLAGFCLTFLLWLILRRRKQKTGKGDCAKQKMFHIEIFIAVIATLFFGGGMIYSAIPYGGALSWKIDEWMRKKEVKLEHNNFFEDGPEGVLADLDEALGLPEELYIANKYQMTFQADGTIQSIYTFLYGKDAEGKTNTYLVDYDAQKSEDMTVWLNGRVNADYDENMRLEPMLTILEKAACEQTVSVWSQSRDADNYEILYLGRRAFKTAEGLVYLSGDADGDGIETGSSHFENLKAGGEIIGFEVSLHIPESEEVLPVRYLMEPEYVSPNVLNQGHQEQQTDEAKKAESWIVDKTDGTMYFFLNENRGWRLVVADAAAGSRFYMLERTENGGSDWKCVNEDPFGGAIGVTEGLVFFDENFGIAGLTGASQSYSELYFTRDGGGTFEKIRLPLDTVTELPESAAECDLTVRDYDYFCMPQKEKGILTIKAVTEAGEREGILFQSQDSGGPWTYVGIISE